MIQALSTGHEGSMSTIHASGAAEALWRLETLALLEASVSQGTIGRQVRRVVDAVVVVGRRQQRRVVRSVHLVDDQLTVVYTCS